MKDYFSKEDREKIARAVKEAEEKTSGEIVPCIVRKSDDYDEALWKGSFFAGLFVFTVILFLHFSGAYPDVSLKLLSVLVAGSSLLAFLASMFLPVLRKYFAGSELISRRVHQRALEAFIEEEVFATKDRTGILIFISYYERMVVVLGDTKINELVTREEWTDVVQTITGGLKKGEALQGILHAIEKCGRLLERTGLYIKPDDTNELSNDFRIKE